MGSGRDKRKKSKGKVPGQGELKTAKKTEKNDSKAERRAAKVIEVGVSGNAAVPLVDVSSLPTNIFLLKSCSEDYNVLHGSYGLGLISKSCREERTILTPC